MSHFCEYLENYIRLIELEVARVVFIPTFPQNKPIFGVNVISVIFYKNLGPEISARKLLINFGLTRFVFSKAF